MELEDSIKQYLENKMSEGERLAFKQQMDMDEQLREEVAFQREMYNFFDQRDEVNTLRNTLQAAENDFFGEGVPKKTKKRNFKPLIWIFPIAISLFAIYYFISTQSNWASNDEETVSEEYLETKNEVEDTSNTKIELTDDEAKEEENAEEEKEELPPDLKNQPIADAGNYNPNPALEAILTTSFRADQFVELTSPAKGQTFKLKRRKVLFSLRGKTNKEDKLKLVMYDNNPRSFDEDFKMLELLISPTEIAEEEYSISTSANIPLKKGLYYFVISNPKTDGLLYAGKFEVR